MIVAFIIILRSDEVVDLFANFAAMAFISTLDDMAFWLCENGFGGFGPLPRGPALLAFGLSKILIFHHLLALHSNLHLQLQGS